MRFSHKTISKITVLALASAIITGCVTMGKVELEVLKPAQKTAAIKMDDLKLQNQFLKNNQKQKSDFENLVKYDKFRIDSLVSVELIKATAQEIEGSELMRITQIDSLGKYNTPDENALILTNVDIVSEVETEPIYVNSRGAYYAAVRVPYKVEWNVIQQTGAKTFTYHDTVWAEGYRKSFDKLADLVRFNEVIDYIIGKTGVDFAHKIAPHWTLTRRSYYRSGNNDFQRAAYFMDNGAYDKAAQIWEQYIGSGNRSLAGNALLNLAVYYELKGDVDQAIDFAAKAAAKKNELALNYLKTLKNRKVEIKQLLEE